MKRFVTILFIAAVVLCGAVLAQADEPGVAESGGEAAAHLSIGGGFQKIWKETGIYRFLHPKTPEEKAREYRAVLIQTVDAEVAAGHFHAAMEVLQKAHGVDDGLIAALTAKVETAEAAGYEPSRLLPEGAGQFIMILIGLLLIYLAIKKRFEPLLLLPIGFGAILTNIPVAGIAEGPVLGQPGGFLYYFYVVGVQSGVFPLLIFMGVGAMTDFGPLLANPKTALLGASAQFGIFIALLGALGLSHWTGGLIDFNIRDAASIGIIGGADGPTSIFLTSRLSPNLLGGGRCCSLFLHGSGADHSAADHAAVHDTGGTRHHDETAAPRLENREDHLPADGVADLYPVAAIGNAADRDADAR